MTLGDLYASVASLHVGERGVIEVCRKYGVAALRKTMAIMLERAEQVALARLAELPAGEYVAEDWIDDDGLSDEPLRVCVRVTIWPDGFTADFTGSAPQVPGPINTTWTGLQVACREIFKEIVDPHFPNNEGIFRPLRVVCPEGTIFTARRPAAVSTYWETGAYVSDLIWRALFPIATDRLPVGHSLSVCGTIVSGVDEERGQFVLVEPQAGGWGATVDRDGESGLVVAGDGETFNMPVEVCEARYPILVDQYAFNTRLAGTGRYRGGFGLTRDYRVVCDRVELTATFGRHRFLPWGAGGGGEGSANGVEIYPAGTTAPAVRRGKLARYPLHRGDIARLITGIGGGYGDPMTRDPALVQADVWDEFITIEQARDVHGVVINPANLLVDEAATRALRARQ
jgi:N-methylhydantoinase B